jgi:hypothetical protein
MNLSKSLVFILMRCRGNELHTKNMQGSTKTAGQEWLADVE